MPPEESSEKASRIVNETKRILEAVNAFGPKFEERWRKALRLAVVGELEQVSQRFMEEANKE